MPVGVIGTGTAIPPVRLTPPRDTFRMAGRDKLS